MPIFRRLSVAAALTLALPAAVAAQATASFTVSATVVSGCTVSAGNLSFGSYDSTAATDVTASSSITVTCSLGTPYSVGLDAGLYASGGNRRMANGADRLGYALYRDAAHTLVFGSIAALLGVSDVGTGLAQSITVYGSLAAGQVVPLGSYADTITVTVEY